jgi:hypothetical protein
MASAWSVGDGETMKFTVYPIERTLMIVIMSAACFLKSWYHIVITFTLEPCGILVSC